MSDIINAENSPEQAQPSPAAQAQPSAVESAPVQPRPGPRAQAPKSERARTSLSVYLLAFWVILLTFALMAGVFWLYHNSQQQQQTILGLQMRLEQQQQSFEDGQRNLQDNIDKELVDQQSNLQSSLDSLAQDVSRNSARMNAFASTNQDSWKLAEAQYLLRLANQRILLEKDSQNALALALSADDVLREINLVELLGVRKTLAEEIAVLKNTGVVDREGIFLRLTALSNQIDAIPFVETLGPTPEDEDEPAAPANETWRQLVTRKFYVLLHKLGSYVRVRDHGRAVNALLPPSEQSYLQQNLHLMFEQAQVAVLRNDAQIYQETLVKAQNWINQYYTLNDQAKSVLDELQSLQNEDIAPELTNFSNSAAALADYIVKREQASAKNAGGN